MVRLTKETGDCGNGEVKETYCKTQYDRKAFLSVKFYRGRLTMALDSDSSSR